MTHRFPNFFRMVSGCLIFAYACCRGHAWMDSAPASWQNTLVRMPLLGNTLELNRTNAIPLMLQSFGSNQTVKAIIFMPGATDEFYMFRRARAVLTNSTPSLLDAVNALTSQTLIRATFTNSMLLLHTDEDPLDPLVEGEPAFLAAAAKKSTSASRVMLNDADWNTVQPLLKKWLGGDVWPWRQTSESWHFYRHSLAAWDLNGLQALQAIALAGKSRAYLTKPPLHFGRLRATFSCDTRVLATPAITEFPR
jgi:hypothetical protein